MTDTPSDDATRDDKTAEGGADKPAAPDAMAPADGDPAKVPEVGGRGGLDPTRYGDWEKNGRCIDF